MASFSFLEGTQDLLSTPFNTLLLSLQRHNIIFLDENVDKYQVLFSLKSYVENINLTDVSVLCFCTTEIATFDYAQKFAQFMNQQLGEYIGYDILHESRRSSQNVFYFSSISRFINDLKYFQWVRFKKYIIYLLDANQSLKYSILLLLLKKHLAQQNITLILQAYKPSLYLNYLCNNNSIREVSHTTTNQVFIPTIYQVDPLFYTLYTNVPITETNNSDHFWAFLCLKHILRTSLTGTIIVFLADYIDMCDFKDYLFRMENELILHGRFQILYYWNFDELTDHKIFMTPNINARRIILMNLTSGSKLTFPNVRFIIDLGMVNPSYRSDNFITKYQNIKTYITKEEVQWRMSWLSNNQGIYYYTYDREMIYDQDFSPYFISNSQLTLLNFLLFKPLNENLHYFLNQHILPPNQNIVNMTLKSLKDGGFIDHNLTFTYLGSFAQQMPIDPYLSKMVFMALKLQCLDPVLTLASIMSYGSIFKENSKLKDIPTHIYFRYCKNSYSDQAIQIRLFNEWMFSRYVKNKSNFCNSYNLSRPKLEMIAMLRVKLISTLRKIFYELFRKKLNISHANKFSRCFSMVKACIVYSYSAFQISRWKHNTDINDFHELSIFRKLRNYGEIKFPPENIICLNKWSFPVSHFLLNLFSDMKDVSFNFHQYTKADRDFLMSIHKLYTGTSEKLFQKCVHLVKMKISDYNSMIIFLPNILSHLVNYIEEKEINFGCYRQGDLGQKPADFTHLKKIFELPNPYNE